MYLLLVLSQVLFLIFFCPSGKSKGNQLELFPCQSDFPVVLAMPSVRVVLVVLVGFPEVVQIPHSPLPAFSGHGCSVKPDPLALG